MVIPYQHFLHCKHLIQVERRLTHDAPWELGNHEDGYLTGLTNLIEAVAEQSRLIWL